MEKTKPLKTHWKKLHNPDYLGSWDFQPKEEKVLTIDKVGTEMVPDQNGKKDECSVCRFKENVKPMVLNVTNSKAISKVAKSPYIEDWRGVKIQLFVTEVKAFGDLMEAVRVRPIMPQTQRPELKEGTEAMKNVIDYMVKGGDFEKVTDKYIVSPEIKQSIDKAVEG